MTFNYTFNIYISLAMAGDGRKYASLCCNFYAHAVTVTHWIGRTITQQEVDGKYEGVAAPAERFPAERHLSHFDSTSERFLLLQGDCW